MSKIDFPFKVALNIFVCSYADPPGYMGEKPSLKKKVLKVPKRLETQWAHKLNYIFPPKP